eukprot:1886654-Rhodomonas_salina.1
MRVSSYQHAKQTRITVREIHESADKRYAERRLGFSFRAWVSAIGFGFQPSDGFGVWVSALGFRFRPGRNWRLANRSKASCPSIADVTWRNPIPPS